MEWIHLNVKSGFSFFHSGLSIEAIVNYAQKNQLTSIALTDENNLFGAMAFYLEWKLKFKKMMIHFPLLF